MSVSLNNRLYKLEKDIECMLKNASKLSNGIQRHSYSTENTKKPSSTRKTRSPKAYIYCPSSPHRHDTFSVTRCTTTKPAKRLCRCASSKEKSSVTFAETMTLNCSDQHDASAICKCKQSRKVEPGMSRIEGHRKYLSTSYPPQETNCSLTSTERELLLEKEKRVKAECDAKQMETEIALLRMQLEDLIQSKNTAVDLSKELERKYNDLLSEKKEICEKMEKLQRENRRLCSKLEKEISSRKAYLHQTQANAEKAKEAIEYKLEEIQLEAAKSSRIMAENTEMLAKTLKDREKCIKMMQSKADDMNYLIEQKEKEYQTLVDEKKQLEMCLNENKLWNKKLREVNDQLAETVKEHYNKLLTAKNETENLKEEINSYKEKFSELQNQMTVTQEELQKIKCKTASEENQRKVLEEKIKCYEEVEAQYAQKIKCLMLELQKVEDSKRASNRQTKSEMRRLMEEHCKLKQECSEMERKLNLFQAADEKRRKTIEEELCTFTKFVNEKEAILLKEKEELSNLVSELSCVIKQHKMRISELSKCNKQQEELLDSQKAKLALQEKTLEQKMKENEALSHKAQCYEEEMRKMKRVLEEKAQRDRIEIENLERQLADFRSKCAEDEDAIICKDKVIQNQNVLITNLKAQLCQMKQEANHVLGKCNKSNDELKKQNDEIRRLVKELENEKREKCSLLEELKQMECKQRHLENKVAMLEKTVEKYYNVTSKDINKKEEIICSLQKEIASQKADFEMQRQAIEQEKDHAINAAKFATQKLYDTVTDFQQQVETQKKVQKFLTGLLYDKDSVECKPPNCYACFQKQDACSEETKCPTCSYSPSESNSSEEETNLRPSGCLDKCKEIDDIFQISTYSPPKISCSKCSNSTKIFYSPSHCSTKNTYSYGTDRSAEEDSMRMKQLMEFMTSVQTMGNNVEESLEEAAEVCDKMCKNRIVASNPENTSAHNKKASSRVTFKDQPGRCQKKRRVNNNN